MAERQPGGAKRGVAPRSSSPVGQATSSQRWRRRRRRVIRGAPKDRTKRWLHASISISRDVMRSGPRWTATLGAPRRGRPSNPQAPQQAAEVVWSPAVPKRQRDDDHLRAAGDSKTPKVTEDLRHLVVDVQFLEQHSKQPGGPLRPGKARRERLQRRLALVFPPPRVGKPGSSVASRQIAGSPCLSWRPGRCGPGASGHQPSFLASFHCHGCATAKLAVTHCVICGTPSLAGSIFPSPETAGAPSA